MLTSRSAAADEAVRASSQRYTAEALDLDLRDWIEAGIGYLPFLAWFVAGMINQPRVAIAAYVVVGLMLVIRPQLGYLALLPLLTFNHPQGFPPHGAIFLLAAVGLASTILRWSIGQLRLPRSVRPALWCSLAFLALTAFQVFLGAAEFGGVIPLRALSQYDQVFIILSVFAVGLFVLPGRWLTPYYVAFLASYVIVTGVALLHLVAPGLLGVLGLAWMVDPTAAGFRATGVIANPNFLGIALACGLSWIIVTAVWQAAHGRLEQGRWALPIIPAAGLGLILTFSRAAIVALCIGLVAALARRSLRAAGALAAAGVIAAVLIYPLFVEARLGQTFGEASPAGEAALAESDRLRSLMAESAIRAFLDAPIAGHGFATFPEISPTYSGQSALTSAHNLYLKAAAEQGLVGLSLLGAFLISIVVPIWRAGPGPWIASLAVVGAFLAFSFTADSFGSAQSISGAFFLIAAGVAQAAFTRERVLASQGEARGIRWPADGERSGGPGMG